MEHPGFDFSSASLDKSYEDEAAVSRMDDLQNLGAAALPTLSIGDNKVPYHLFLCWVITWSGQRRLDKEINSVPGWIIKMLLNLFSWSIKKVKSKSCINAL